jgi:phosphotriesterase-related protein
MNRRAHLKSIAGLGVLALTGSSLKSFSHSSSGKSVLNEGRIMTVKGPIPSGNLGLTLPHEHVFSIFGKPAVRYPYYNQEKLMDSVVPYLNKLKSLGVKSIVDATTAYFGRHPELLKSISEITGINIITNTGYYAASGDQYVPKHAYTEDAARISERWSFEHQNSIDGTEIYPGFIKTAIDNGPVSDIDKKLIQAAALAHKDSGLVIQTHTGKNIPGAFEVLDVLAGNGVKAEAWIWIHAHHVTQPEDLLRAAKKGAWISFDGINEEQTPHILKMTKHFQDKGLLNKVLYSHDGNSFRRDETRKDYHYLLTGFKEQFMKFGFNEDDFAQITEKNPAGAFTIKKRII